MKNDKPKGEFARRIFKTYLRAYNESKRAAGLPEVKTQYTLKEWWSGAVSTESSDDLYRDFLEWLTDSMREDAEAGFKLLRGAALAHQKTHGTPEEKAARWGAYQAEVDRLRASHPTWSKKSVLVQAGKKFAVASKTIQRHTSDRGPRKS